MLVSESDYTSYRRRKSSFDIRVIATLISLLVIILTGLCVFSVIALRLYYTHHDAITSTRNRTAKFEYGHLSDGKTQVGLVLCNYSFFKFPSVVVLVGLTPHAQFSMHQSAYICVLNQLHLVCGS